MSIVSFFERLQNPDTFGNVISSLENTLEAFGTHMGGQGAAIAQLAWILAGIIHPAPHTLTPPVGLEPYKDPDPAATAAKAAQAKSDQAAALRAQANELQKQADLVSQQ